MSTLELFHIAGGGIGVEAYLDRMLDVPCPEGGDGMFESIGQFTSRAEFCRALKEAAFGFRGAPTRTFIAKLLRLGARKLQKAQEKDRALYFRRANEIQSMAGRDLQRVHQKAARATVGGCFLSRTKMWDLTRDEVLEAVLKVVRDHVSFIDAEADKFGISFPSAKPIVSSRAMARPSSRDRLVAYIHANRDRFFDPFAECSVDPAFGIADAPGFERNRDGSICFYFSDRKFHEIAGSEAEVLALKKNLAGKKLLKVALAGKQGSRFVTKMPIGRFEGEMRRSPMVCVFGGVLDE